MPENYAIISLGGKQYVVHEGERFLVERLDQDEGKTFHPEVLFLGGGGTADLAPTATVTAKVVAHERGPKVRIGKYKPKSGYKKHTGFRASLTQIEIESIGSAKAKAKAAPDKPAAEKPAPAPKAQAAPAATPESAAEEAPKGLPTDYAGMTVAAISGAAPGWNRPMLEAALQYEQQHANRKGAIAALEHALAAKEDH